MSPFSSITNKEFALNTVKARKLFTPDWKELSAHVGHVIFVWGNCKKYYRDYFRTVQGVKYLGKGITIEDVFVMKVSSGIPYLIDSTSSDYVNATKARVHGELYYVTVPTLSSIDMVMGNNIACEREQRYIVCCEQPSAYKDKSVPPTIQAWVHLNKRSVFDLETRTAQFAPSIKEFDRWGWSHTNKSRQDN